MRKAVQLNALDSYRLYHLICAYLEADREPIPLMSKEPARDVARRVQTGPTELNITAEEYKGILSVFRMTSKIDTPINLDRDEKREFEDQFLELGPADDWGEKGTLYYGPGWETKREEVLEAYNYQCENCGIGVQEHKKRYNHGLHIHHKTPFREFDNREAANRKSNLEPLCSICHPKKEHGDTEAARLS